MKVCVVGLGEVGASVLKYCAWRLGGAACFGFDPRAYKDLNTVEWFFTALTTSEWEKLPTCDVYVICTPTDAVESACSLISREAKLIAVESTVEVGTCKRIYETTERVPVVHCPHRWWSVDPVNHGVRQPRVLGGVTEEALQLGINFYQGIEIPIHVVRPVEVAEFSKVVENAYEYLKIAFAEELAMKCDRLGIPYDQLRQAVNTNTTQDVKLMEARDGIGGKCLPMCAEKVSLLLMDDAIARNEEYVKWLKESGLRSE